MNILSSFFRTLLTTTLMYSSMAFSAPIVISNTTFKRSTNQVRYVFTNSKTAIALDSDTLAIEPLDLGAYQGFLTAYSNAKNDQNWCSPNPLRHRCDTIELKIGNDAKIFRISDSGCDLGAKAKICLAFKPYFALRQKYESSICIINDLVTIHRRHDSLLKVANEFDMRKTSTQEEDSLYKSLDYLPLGKDFFTGFDSMKNGRHIPLPEPEDKLYLFKPGFARIDCKLYIKSEDSTPKNNSDKSF